jgi:hypothetical protein
MEDGTYRVGYYNQLIPVTLSHGYIVAIKSTDSKVYPENTLIGKWTDMDTGIVYWDEVELIEDLLTAANVARQRGEIAISDCFNNCEFRV